MIHRRIAALLIAVASLHLSLAPVGATCTDGLGAGTMAKGDRVVAVAAHGGQHGGAEIAASPLPSGDGESWGAAASPPGEEDSCSTGSSTRCCANMTTCSTTVARAEPGRAVAAAAPVDRAHAAPIDVPPSFRPTLEPPPPKD